MTTDEHEIARIKIISVAQSMITGDVSLIEGARELCDLCHHIGASEDKLFYPVIGFESQTDDYPLGQVRQLYSQDLLNKMDKEIAVYLTQAKPGLKQACNQIIAALER
jgi:hypothetical protein